MDRSLHHFFDDVLKDRPRALAMAKPIFFTSGQGVKKLSKKRSEVKPLLSHPSYDRTKDSQIKCYRTYNIRLSSRLWCL